MSKQVSEQDQYLHENRAWNWQWPNERNCWRTSQSGKWSPPKTRFTATGPSKRTVAKRAARRTAKRSH